MRGLRQSAIVSVAMAMALHACGGVDDSVPDGNDAHVDARIDARLDTGADTVCSDCSTPTDADACIPDCTGRVCGPDGCGGSCGSSCPSGQTCNTDGQCITPPPECPCFYGSCSSCYCGAGVVDYASMHNCVIPPLAGHEGDLLSCDNGHWSLGTACPSTGCTVAPPMTPDHCNAPPGGPPCPCYFGACTSCYCGQGAQDYASAHGCSLGAATGHTGDLLSCEGSGTWTVGTACSSTGCYVAPPMVPDSCNPAPGSGPRLWIAYDTSTASCRPSTDAFFGCILPHTNFNDLARTFSSGRAIQFGASAVLNPGCSYVHSTSATMSQDSATLQCIENQTHWDLHNDDVVLYYPSFPGCQDGRNHWHIPANANGRSVSVEMAYGFTSNSCNCQQALGTHEVYEASARYNAADCCNGQFGCTANPRPYGWYSFSACGRTWTAQTLSTASELFNASACQRLVVH